MPWAEVSGSVGDMSKGLTGILKDTVGEASLGGKVVGKMEKAAGALSGFGDVGVKVKITGANIPMLVNDEKSKIALSLAQVIFKSTEGLDKKSYAVYLLPLSGIVCALLALSGTKSRISIVGMVLLGGLISIVGLYNVYTADLSNLIVKIKIGQGVWHTLYAFLLIAVTGVVWLFIEKKKS